ncbi:baseplate multidomain protein megatron [Tropicimonas sp. S265A]|uniref:baseplate multidomain protein megatron n=1 Tax=Tropicimonas sp. S265A TaxID=3415134 RepID=UPI003C7DA9E6
MATLVLSAAGAAIGSSIGGAAFGISATVIGRAIGATIGQAIDQRLMGAGSQAVETGRVERFRLSDAAEGAPIPVVFGKMRVAGQIIWASRFLERSQTTETGGGGGKGSPSAPSTSVTSYSYSVSLAVALGEGTMRNIGRIWADGMEISKTGLNLRFYPGSQTQMPDPKIAAVQGGDVPAFRGTAYVVIENLELGQFGNRVPQFTFEVYRPAQPRNSKGPLASRIPGVAMMPGTGEYALASTAVHWSGSPGKNTSINVNTPGGKSDLLISLDAMNNEMPACRAVSLVVSWFGDDLRCGTCRIRPKVEQKNYEAAQQPYAIGSYTRAALQMMPRVNGKPIYGGTPNDASVIEAIRTLTASGKKVTYYPFVLMDQLSGNGRADPYSEAPHQPIMPWRGRITLNKAPGVVASLDGTDQASAQVQDFFGTASTGFTIQNGAVSWTATPDWRYRHFILHQAYLCKAAGGVDAFCIGSEMRGLTQIRGANNSFPAVDALRQLARDVRAILGPGTKIGYAADWSEYFGYHPQDGSGDVFFHLDPLWSDPDIDFIGIDNYMPLSDWRDGLDHLDADAGAVHALQYLGSNVAGGEGYDWYYKSQEDRDAQVRTPIEDGLAGEDWVFRYKDIRNWWGNAHHNRIGGVRQAGPTSWVPQSKPVWFMEIGCAAIDKGANQPNKFIDLYSSESALPHYSLGRRDDLMQHAYYSATLNHWAAPENNPVSTVYGGKMVDTSRIHGWAWDARPYPFFPNSSALWADGVNYPRGHWLNGRITAQDLGEVVAEICDRAGLKSYDVSDLRGLVRGFTISELQSPRSALQPLMLAHGFEAIEKDGTLLFKSRRNQRPIEIDPDALAMDPDLGGRMQRTRAPEAELSGRVQLQYVEEGGDYAVRSAEAVLPGDDTQAVSQSSFPMSLTYSEAQGIVERWLAEARIARDAVRFALPMSSRSVQAGDLVQVGGDAAEPQVYRVDRIEEANLRTIDAVRVSGSVYQASDAVEALPPVKPFQPPLPVFPVFLDIPLLSDDVPEHSPRIAIAAQPWPGSVAVYGSTEDAGYALEKLVGSSAAIGITETEMVRAQPGLIDRGGALRVDFTNGMPSSIGMDALLRGGNLAAIGDGSPQGWELFQFQTTTLVAPDVYDLSMRLRGQLGTDADMPDVWPVGSLVVLLPAGTEALTVPSQSLLLPRYYRIGSAQRPIDDPSYVLATPTFKGLGLRPYAPAQLRAERVADGFEIAFLRRTRIDGDRWDLADVPLGEAREDYLLKVVRTDETVLRQVSLSSPEWTYSNALWMADGSPVAFHIEVAQVSERFGPGAWKRITVNV